MRALVFVCLLSSAAAAAPGGDLPLDAFRPAVDSRGFVTVDGAAVLERGQPSFGLVTTWAKGLLSLDDGGARYRVTDVISPTLIGAVGVGARFELGLALPLGVVSGDAGGDTIATQGLGDLGLDGKFALGDTGPVRWAVVGAATLPTGTRDAWLSAGHSAIGARLVAEAHLGRFRVGGNAGVRAPLGGDASFMDPGGATVSLGAALPVGGAVAYELSPGVIELVGEGYALVPVHDGGYFPVEAIGGARFYLAKSSHLELGAGAGLGGAGGNPEWRAFLGIVFEPTSIEHARGHMELVADAEPPPPPAAAEPPPPDPKADRDRDGVPDVDDLCPDEPGVADQAGCPEHEFDPDRVADKDDMCDRAQCPDRDVVKVGETELIVLDDIDFEFDSAVIERRSYHVLDAIAHTLELNPDVRKLEVGGHTDERGPDDYNLALSQRRADAVVAYLVAHGIDAARLTAEGYGERVPKDPHHTEAAWRVNRRVEFTILDRHR